MPDENSEENTAGPVEYSKRGPKEVNLELTLGKYSIFILQGLA